MPDLDLRLTRRQSRWRSPTREWASGLSAWQQTTRTSGRLSGAQTAKIKQALRAFYKCDAGGKANVCGTVICSKHWKRRFENDPEAAGQRWYCKASFARYKTKYGVLVELRDEFGNVYWISCDFPGEWNDVKWMAVEEAHKATSPRELFDMLEEIHPYTGDGFLRPATRSQCFGEDVTGVYKVVDIQNYCAMPVWSWSNILAFSKAASASSSAAGV